MDCNLYVIGYHPARGRSKMPSEAKYTPHENKGGKAQRVRFETGTKLMEECSLTPKDLQHTVLLNLFASWANKTSEMRA